MNEHKAVDIYKLQQLKVHQGLLVLYCTLKKLHCYAASLDSFVECLCCDLRYWRSSDLTLLEQMGIRKVIFLPCDQY